MDVVSLSERPTGRHCSTLGMVGGGEAPAGAGGQQGRSDLWAMCQKGDGLLPIRKVMQATQPGNKGDSGWNGQMLTAWDNFQHWVYRRDRSDYLSLSI